MLEELVEVTRQYCLARLKAGLPWCEKEIACDIPAGNLIFEWAEFALVSKWLLEPQGGKTSLST